MHTVIPIPGTISGVCVCGITMVRSGPHPKASVCPDRRWWNFWFHDISKDGWHRCRRVDSPIVKFWEK